MGKKKTGELEIIDSLMEEIEKARTIFQQKKKIKFNGGYYGK